jgi:cell wall-associated NlpC family hydrolase
MWCGATGVAVALGSLAPLPRAGATPGVDQGVPSQSQIGAEQAQVQQLEATIAQQQQQGDVLAQQFDNAQQQVDNAHAAAATTQASIDKTRTVLAADRAELAHDAVNAYIFATPDTDFTALFTSPATKADARQQYVETAVGNITSAAQAVQSDQARLVVQLNQQQAQEQQAAAAADRARLLSAANDTQTKASLATLAQVSGTLANDVAAFAIARAQQAAAEATAAADPGTARAAADAAASAAAVAGAVGGGPNSAADQAAAQAATAAGITVTGSPTGSGAGVAAVIAAESQLGVQYVLGGTTPGVGFDCSGLTQWAWGQAGVAIARTSESQWATLPHVPLTSLQPGDLLFTEGASPGHVVMYVGPGPYGNETVIQAPHTGTRVSFTSALYLGAITGAARP